MELQLASDIVTLILLGLMLLLGGLPLVLLITRRVTRPPFRIGSFRQLYVAWACLLGASSVWNLSRDVRFSLYEAGTDNFMRFAFLAVGAVLILFIGAKYRFAFLSELTGGALGLFSLFAFWGMASTLWSVSPAGTLYKSFEYAAMLALFALAASLVNLTIKGSQNRALALKSVFDFSWFLVFSLIISVYLGLMIWPDYALLRAGRDAAGMLGFSIQGALPGISANALGQLGAIMGIVAIVRLLQQPRYKVLYVSILVVSLLTMVLTQSRSPILAFSVAVVVVLVVSRRFVVLAVVGTLLGALLSTQYEQLLYEFLRRGQSDESLTSLTGRVAYWQASLDAFWDKPLEGYGANVGGRYVLESALGQTTVSTVHSLWVEVLLDTGAIGFILLLVALLMTGVWLFRLRSQARMYPVTHMLWLESLGVLTVLCVRSVFAVTMVWSWNVLTFGVILVFISVVRRQVAQASNAGASFAQSIPAARRRRSGIRG